MEPLQPFNYGNAIAQGANIQNAQAQNALARQRLDPNSTENQLQQQQLLQAKQSVNAGDINQQFENTRLMNAYMAQISQDPSTAKLLIPDLQKRGIVKTDFSIEGLTPEQIKENATKAYNATHAALMSYQMTNPKDNLPNNWKTALLYNAAGPEMRQSFDTTVRAPIVLNQGGSNVVALPNQIFGGGQNALTGRPQNVPTGQQSQAGISQNTLSAPRGMVVMPKTLAPNERPDVKAAQTEATKTADIQTTNKEQAKVDLPQKKLDLEYGLQQVDALLSHPGLNSAVGPIASKVSGVTQMVNPDVADFNARRETLQSSVFVDARQMLKGGGSITDYEGKKAEDSRLRAQNAQSPTAFKEALSEYKYWVARGFQKLQKSAGESSDQFINLPEAPKGLQKIQKQLYEKSGGKMGQPQPSNGIPAGWKVE
jgi:hypothetical protein